MLLPEKTREYTFPSTEQDHPLYISIYPTNLPPYPPLAYAGQIPWFCIQRGRIASTKEAPL